MKVLKILSLCALMSASFILMSMDGCDKPGTPPKGVDLILYLNKPHTINGCSPFITWKLEPIDVDSSTGYARSITISRNNVAPASIGNGICIFQEIPGLHIGEAPAVGRWRIMVEADLWATSCVVDLRPGINGVYFEQSASGCK